MNKQSLTPKAFANHRWHKMHERVRNHPSYDHVSIEVTRKQFVDWVTQNWAQVLEIRKTGEEASIDRIDSKGNYELENMRIISIRENRAAGAHTWNTARTSALRATHKPKNCPTCNQVFDKRNNEKWHNFAKRRYCSGTCRIAARSRDALGRVELTKFK